MRTDFGFTYMALTASLLLALGGCAQDTRAPPKVIDGVIDLSDWDFERDGPVKLGGDWDFWWNTVIPPAELMQPVGLPPQGRYHVPSIWNGQPNPARPGETIPAHGHATLRARILLPDSLPRTMALRVWYPGNSSNVFTSTADGIQHAATIGQFGTSRENSIPSWKRILTPLTLTSLTESVIVIHAANYHWHRSGVEGVPVLGEYQSIVDINAKVYGTACAIAGLLLVMGLYHLLLFFQRHEDKASLWLGILCLLSSLRQVITERVFEPFLPMTELVFVTLARLEYVSLPLALLALSFFVYHLTPSRQFLQVLRLNTPLTIAESLWILLIPSGEYSVILNLLHVHGIFLICSAMFYLAITGYRGHRESVESFMAMMVFFVTVAIEIYMNQTTGSTWNIIPAGLCFLVLSQSFILARRFAKAHRTAEHLTTHLQEEVTKQTHALQEANEDLISSHAKEMESSKKALIQTEKLSQLGQLISSIGHEMASPIMLLNITSEDNEDTIERFEKTLMPIFDDSDDAQEALRVFQRLFDELKESNTKTSVAAKRLYDVSQALRTQSRNDTEASKHSIHEIIHECLIIVQGKLKTLEVQENLEETPSITCYRSRIGQVVTNLLANASDALHDKRAATMENGRQTFNGKVLVENTLAKRNDISGVLVSISDNGDGVPDAIKDKIFNEFFTTKPSGQGTGLGLSMCAEIVQDHGGTLTISDSQALGGACFELWLPIDSAAT